jgi:uncharacterized protein (TIGR00369 family)
VSSEPAAEVPEGFRPMAAGGGFVEMTGPLFYRRHEGVLQMGFRVEARHCNPMGICHGGMLATFADMLLPITAIRTVEALRHHFLPTISLQVDYLASAALGDWVQGEAQVLRHTRSLVFMQGLVTAADQPAMRVSGVFKIGPQITRPEPASG